MATNPKILNLPLMSRSADIMPGSIDRDNRTVDVVFSEGAPVLRSDFWSGKKWIEKLSMDPKAVRLGRLNNGAPLLDSHSGRSVRDQLGVVERDSAKISGKRGVATVRFSRRADVEPVWNDVVDGIVRKVSVSYVTHRVEQDEGTDEKIPTRTAVDWEPHEISMVTIAADDGAEVRAADGTIKPPQDLPTYPCELVTRAAPVAAPKEPVMSDPNVEPAGTVVAQNPLLPDPPATPPAPPPEPTDRQRGVLAERERTLKIRTACRNAQMSRQLEDELIASDLTTEQAQDRVFVELGRRDPPAPSGAARLGGGVQIAGDDPLIHCRAGIVNALLHRIDGERFKLEDVGRKYRGMTLLDIGRAFLSARGAHVGMMSKDELVDHMLMRMQRTGYHTTSDFPSLLEDAASKNLRSAYDASPQTWRPISVLRSLTDFKPSRQLQIGDAPPLDEVLEHGEFTSGTIGEAKETVQLKTYGKIFAITRQALINDDLNAFGEIPAAFGRKTADKESDLAWLQITSNPTMGDGSALFTNGTPHFNLSGTSDAISTTSLGAGRAALRSQKGIDGVTPLNLVPAYLITNAAKETIGDQNVTQITPAQASNVNPFGPSGRTPLSLIVEPRLDAASATAWYVAAAAASAPVLYYATLDGQQGPDLRQQEGFNIDGVQFRCRRDVAFKAADWRAIFKNNGA